MLTKTLSAGPPPSTPTFSPGAPARVYSLQDSTCNGSPGYWLLLDNQLDQFAVGCAGQTNPSCAISACLAACNARSDCVGFLIQSDDAGGPDRYPWACSVDGSRGHSRQYDGAIYGGMANPFPHCEDDDGAKMAVLNHPADLVNR